MPLEGKYSDTGSISMFKFKSSATLNDNKYTFHEHHSLSFTGIQKNMRTWEHSVRCLPVASGCKLISIQVLVHMIID